MHNEKKALDKYLEENIPRINETTGTQYNYSLMHAKYIFTNGYEAWYKELRKNKTEDKFFDYEFNGTVTL